MRIARENKTRTRQKFRFKMEVLYISLINK